MCHLSRDLSISISALHKAARSYAEQGIPVFPCVPGTKRPATENGFKDATTDLAVIDALWAEQDYNLALSPEAAGWAVIDSDGGAVGEATWAALQAEHGLAPETYEVDTPGGGIHRYFAGSLPPSVGTEHKGLGPKLDTRGRGSYVLVPPSVVDGKFYRVRADRDMADVPAWIEPAAATFKQSVASAIDRSQFDSPINVDRATAWLRRQPAVEQGAGADSLTYDAACMLRDLGISPEKSLALMLDLWPCQPQDERYEPFIARKIDSAWAYAQNEPGAWGTAPPTETFSQALDKLGLITPGAEGRKPPFYVYRLPELAARPPLKWLVPELIPERSVGMIYGPPKSLKTFVALTISLPVAMHRDVIMVAGEGEDEAKERANAWCVLNGHGIDAPRLGIVADMPYASIEGQVDRFCAQVKEQGFAPCLIIIDTAARAMLGLDEQSAKDVGTFIAAMDAIKRKLDCAILLVHHTGKDAAKGARGSSALLAAVDYSAEVVRHERSHAVALWVRAMRNAPERERPWTWEGKPLAGTLAFQPIDRDAYDAITKGAKGLRPERVALALRSLEQPGKGPVEVTTMVLAEALLAPLEGESPEQHEEAKGRMANALSLGAKGALAAFAQGEGRGRVWRLP